MIQPFNEINQNLQKIVVDTLSLNLINSITYGPTSVFEIGMISGREGAY
jgi:hypothetical protein